MKIDTISESVSIEMNGSGDRILTTIVSGVFPSTNVSSISVNDVQFCKVPGMKVMFGWWR